MERILFSLRPDDAAAEDVGRTLNEVCRETGLGGQPQQLDRLHVTVNGVGDHAGFPDDIVQLARNAGSRVRFAPFEVRLDRIGSYSAGRRPCDLIMLEGDAGVLDIVRLQRALAAEMARCGLGKYVRRSLFTPHMSVLYRARPLAPRRVGAIRWTARKLLLIHSELGRTRHHLLGEWPLSA